FIAATWGSRAKFAAPICWDSISGPTAVIRITGLTRAVARVRAMCGAAGRGLAPPPTGAPSPIVGGGSVGGREAMRNRQRHGDKLVIFRNKTLIRDLTILSP